MSLQGSPRLELDLRRRRSEACVASLALILSPVAPLSVLPQSAAISCAALTVLLVALGLWRAGWIGHRERIHRVVWTSQGRWLLEDGRGRSCEAVLRGDSRVGGGFVWLRWNANRTRSMLLLSGDMDASELRRLRTRLQLEGMRTPHPDEVAADT